MFGPINTAPDYLGGSDLRNYKSTIEALQKRPGQNCSLVCNSKAFFIHFKTQGGCKEARTVASEIKANGYYETSARPTPGSTVSLRRQLSLSLRANGMEQ